MKKLNFLLIGILMSTMAFSQDYFPFPDSNAIWNSQYGGYYGSPKERFGLIGDTTLNNQDYKKVYRIVDDSTLNFDNMTYFAAIRENDIKQVFVKLTDFEDEILIYDFSLNVGDTMFSNSPSGYLNYDNCIITGIDSIELENNQFRRRFRINETYYTQDYWIEGIGSMGGFFNPIMEYIIGSYCELTCFKDNETAIYVNNPECDKCFCTLLTPVEEFEKGKDFINIYPNPTTNELTIDIKKENGISSIKIFNSYGKQLENRESNSFPTKMNIDYLPNGVYIIKVDIENNSYIRKIIKTE